MTNILTANLLSVYPSTLTIGGHLHTSAFTWTRVMVARFNQRPRKGVAWERVSGPAGGAL